ncbi:uncharacterized protein SPSK_10155 [Sporothrix schenckii 1099-18]|uniref:Uncharacterized protein n=1 Tax=Sporothrix schenckii 1099-18 TaxID=1397361 RepID=A0A0F2M3R6_SPOSC|nr:uncharacterized protein SPSK_10155 [Sporothrix schenckii 1099-18]KJR84343.1 hypothetical protein SPSK_10155 [Sporothrix schenckii 1099-18]
MARVVTQPTRSETAGRKAESGARVRTHTPKKDERKKERDSRCNGIITLKTVTREEVTKHDLRILRVTRQKAERTKDETATGQDKPYTT